MHITDFYPSLLEEAKLSKDPSRKICAAAFDKELNRVASGWNGAPRGVADWPARYSNKSLKHFFVNHAESNLVANAARLGAKLEGCSVLLTELPPCARCAGILTQAGIKEVWHPFAPTSGRPVRNAWLEDFKYARIIFAEAGVKVFSF